MISPLRNDWNWFIPDK